MPEPIRELEAGVKNISKYIHSEEPVSEAKQGPGDALLMPECGPKLGQRPWDAVPETIKLGEQGARDAVPEVEHGSRNDGFSVRNDDFNNGFKLVPLKARVTMKNYYRIVVFCDKMNMDLSLDVIDIRKRLCDIYDRHGRLRRGAGGKVADDFKLYRIFDEETGKDFIVMTQKITCNIRDVELGHLYSIYDKDATPVKVGVTC